MSYVITVVEKREVQKVVRGAYCVVGQIEVSRDADMRRLDSEKGATRITDTYGYAPDVEQTVDETTDVYRQEVEALDLAEVIKAVNGMKG